MPAVADVRRAWWRGWRKCSPGWAANWTGCSRPWTRGSFRNWLPPVRRAAATVRDELRKAVEVPVALQPCIRDLWHDHVLFTGDEVTGIVDYGALRIDSVAADLARLLGSLVEDDRDAWGVGLAAYQSVRPLAAHESMLLYAYDRANVLLSGLHWLQWVFCRGYTFADPRCVLRRVETNLRRLRRLTEP